MKTNKIIYWIATGLLSALILMSASMYIFNHAEIVLGFTIVGYPVYIIYPLAIAKLLGIIAILTKKSIFLKYLAYAGFLFNFILAFFAHIMAQDGQFGGAAVALVLLTVSYIYDRKVFATKE